MRRAEANTALTLSTLAFVVAFAVWGMLAPMAKFFQGSLGLTEQQTWMLVAIPVILGSALRLPVGMLAERFGGRIVMSILLVFVSLPAFYLSYADSYSELIAGGLLIGIGGTAFPVGVAFTSRWFPPERQGFALGVFGAGNLGQSIALFGIPLVAQGLGWQNGYRLFGATALAYGVLFLVLARDAPAAGKPKGLGDMLRVYARPFSWLFSLYYFVTFGGFVALSIGLPKLLQEIFHLTTQDAGMRVAGFVLVATAMRPLGGWISDQLGAAKLLVLVFLGSGILAMALTLDHIIPFTVGALGVAACVGLGNGAVFKLVPSYFPGDTGTVTGLVGAVGGLGGFFPPIVLGMIKTHLGSYMLGFLLLSMFCQLCLAANYLIFLRPPHHVERRPGAPGGAALQTGILESASALQGGRTE